MDDKSPTVWSRFWMRHSNPWSGWSRVAALPAIGGAVAAHSLLLLGIVLLWLVINPVMFPPPANDRAWMTRGVLGEQIYAASGPRLRSDLPTLLSLVTLPVFAAFLWFAWQRDPVAATLSGLLVAVLKFWYVDRMVILYDQSRNSTSTDQAV